MDELRVAVRSDSNKYLPGFWDRDYWVLWLLNYMVEVDREHIVVPFKCVSHLMQHHFTLKKYSTAHARYDIHNTLHMLTKGIQTKHSHLC